jgi:drug/metabolite transporter (DMT)-like permease
MVSHTLTKYLAAYLPVSELMFSRFIFGPLLLLPFFLGGKISFKVNRWWLIWVRTACGVTAMVGYFWALKLGDPGKVSLIFQCSSLWVFIIAKFLFKDNPKWQTKLSVPIALFGLWLVIRPENMLSFALPEILALIASFINAGVLLSLKELRNDHGTYTIMFANYGISSVLVGAWMIPDFIVPSSTTLVVLLLSMGFIGFIGNLCMTTGFKYTSATVASNLMLMLVPLMYITGIVFFGETVDTISLVGVGVVLGSLGLMSVYQ